MAPAKMAVAPWARCLASAACLIIYSLLPGVFSEESGANARAKGPSLGPSFDLMPREKIFLYIKAGDPAKMRCPVLNKGIYTVSFVKVSGPESPKTISMGEDIQINKDNRYKLYTEAVNSAIVTTMTVNQVMWNDNGTYVCTVNTNIPKRLEFYLQVLMSPQIVDTNTTKVVFAEVGDKVILRCNAFGNPVPQIRWIRSDFRPLGGAGGNIIYKSAGTQGIFVINEVKEEDRGTYICIAANDLDEGERKHVNLFVKYPPIVTAVKSEVGQMQGQNLDAYLECEVRAYPPANIKWIHRDAKTANTLEITNDDRHTIEDSGSIFLSGNDWIRYRLTVKLVRSDDFGEYFCRAENIYGQNEAQITFFQLETRQFIFPAQNELTRDTLIDEIMG